MSVCVQVCVGVRVIEREEMEQQLSGEEKTSPRRRKKCRNVGLFVCPLSLFFLLQKYDIATIS